MSSFFQQYNICIYIYKLLIKKKKKKLYVLYYTVVTRKYTIPVEKTSEMYLSPTRLMKYLNEVLHTRSNGIL